MRHRYPAGPRPAITPWPTLADAAYYGVAGRAVRTIAPHTEADPAAILLQFLAAFGNMVGPAPHCVVESTRHNLNLFVILALQCVCALIEPGAAQQRSHPTRKRNRRTTATSDSRRWFSSTWFCPHFVGPLGLRDWRGLCVIEWHRIQSLIFL
jgi:hypothetical protein